MTQVGKPSLTGPPAHRLTAGVIRTYHIVVRPFAEIGREWGGHRNTSKDYQHFSASGR